MFKDKVFSASIIVSLSLHIFAIFAFVLVITPRGFTYNKFPEASFLGPILEANAFQAGVNLKAAFMITPYREDFTASGLSVWQSYDYLNKNILLEENLEKTKFAEPLGSKQIPDLITNDKN